MKNFIKITLIICATFLFSNVKAQTEYYTVQDDDVNVFGGYILSLTEQGEENIKDTNIIFPETLHGQKITGFLNINDEQKGLFENKNLHFVKLPKTVEYIGSRMFAHNNNMILCNFKELVNLKYIGWLAFAGFKGLDDSVNTHKLDFSGLHNLEKIGLLAFWSNANIKTVDFTDCFNLKVVGFLSFFTIAAKNEDKTVDSLIFKNCKNLSYIGDYAFTSYAREQDSIYQQNLNQKHIDFSGCKSLLYFGGAVLAMGVNNASYIESYLTPPEINDLTFNSWKKRIYAGSMTYTALFNEYVISINEISNNVMGKNLSQNNQEMLTSINQQKNAKDSVQFKIRNHSINNIEISNVLCTTEGCTLNWTNGTIETDKTQIVTVTFPEGTEDYTATITIEGENLKGNTTVNISKTGEVTTDDNLLCGISQQEKQLQENDITVYPNPATDELHINLKKAQATNHIKIVNLQGKTVYENQEFKGSVINISKLPPAVYVILVNEKYTTFVKN